MPISTAPDFQVWIASFDSVGDEHAIVRVSGDSTIDSGETGFDIVAMLQGHPQLHRPVDIILDTVHDRYFIVDSDGTSDSILQGSISELMAGGTPTLTILYSQTPAVNEGEGITGVAIDPDNGIVYFTERNLVQKVSYDTAGQVPVTLADLGFDDITGMPNYANEIAFNPVTGQIFVVSTESFNDFVESPPGSGNFILGTLVTRNAIYRVDNVDPADADSTGNTITKLQWDTHEQMHPFLGGPDTGFFPDELGMITGIDVDTTTGEVYFTTEQLNGGGGGEVGGIYRVGPDGGAHTVLYSETNATDQNFQYIDVDSAGGRYFVTSIEPATGEHRVYTHSLTAGTPTALASVAVDGLSPEGVFVVNAPTLAGTDADATASETAGPGSGFSLAVAALAGASINDLDTAALADQLAGARVRISDGFGAAAGSSEQLTINGTTSGTLLSGISYSYDSATGVMTLSGVGTFDDYEAALALVSYSISGDNPDDYGAATTRTLSYSAFDGLLYSDEADAIVDVAAANDAPVNTVGAPVSLTEGDSVAIAGLAVGDVDADPANDSIQVTLSATLGTITVSTSEPGGITAGQVGGNGTGTVTITATQDAINATFGAVNAVIYTAGGAGGIDALTMTTNDLGENGAGGAQQDIDAVLVTVINLNDPPTAPATNSVATDEDEASAATAIGATDPDGDTLTYSEKPGAGAANGTVTFDQINGTFTYTPDPDFNGSDSFTILIDDGNGGTAEQVVTVEVTAVNDAPTAPATGSVTTAEDAASAATSIGASDVEGDTLTYSLAAAAAHGSVSFDQANGTFTYTPDSNYNGSDSFTILIDDGNGGTAEQVVSVTVTPVNDAPTAPATNSVSTAEDTASAATAIGASDIDGDALTYSEKAGAGAANGTVTLDQANGTFTYTPDPDFNGSDSFTILIDDGNGGTAEQSVSVSVSAVNDAPTGVAGDLAAPEDAVNGSSAGTLVAQDPDSSSFTYELLDNAGGRFAMDSNGNVTVADGLLLDYEQAASHTIRVRVTDDMGASSEFDTTVSVTDVLGEDVTGDGRDNIFWGGAENDVLRGMDGNDTLVGGGGLDTLEGGNGADTIEGGDGNDYLEGGAGDDILSGGLGADFLFGGDGKDVYVLRKGEADGDTITGFWGQGASDGDSIVLEGYGAGTTFTRVGGGSSTLYEINDNGFVEYVTILATGQVHSTDYSFTDPMLSVIYQPPTDFPTG